MPKWFSPAAVICGIMFALSPVLIARAPYESTMGLVQKIFYYHMPSASMFLISAVVCGIASARFLFRGSPRQDRLAIGAQCLTGGVAKIDRRQIGDIRPGPHRDDPRRRLRRGDVDRAQHGMRVGRAHHPHVQLMCEGNVADKPAAPGDQRRVLQARHRAAENAALRLIGGERACHRP